MALTANGLRVGRAGASDLADMREYIQQAQEEEAKRRRQEMKERTDKLNQDIYDMLSDEEYQKWYDSTPNDNAGFLAACEVKYTELTTQPHPVDEAQTIERTLSADSDMVAESNGILEWVEAEPKRMVLSAVRSKVTVSRSWAERHLNTDEGFTAALDKAFGVGNWTLGGSA